MPYKKNDALHDILQANPTAGLPLFGDKLTKSQRHIVDNAPRSIAVATDTRKLAHTILAFDPDVLNRKELLVYDAIVMLSRHSDGDATNEEIRTYLDTEINRVVGRTFGLREKGVVTKSRKRKCRVTGNVVTAWKVVDHLHFTD